MDDTSATRADAAEETTGDRIDELRAVIDAQARVIEAMQERLDQMETSVSPPSETRVDVVPSSVALPDLHAPTSRRNLMTKGAAAAAGAAIAGTVLNVAAANPAAAAGPISGDGDPGVYGLANPNTGVGVKGETLLGMGVFGSASATELEAFGVAGHGFSPDSFGVGGENFASSRHAVGVRGKTGSSSGRGVVGSATSSNGTTSGVYGESASTGGQGVEGRATATTGETSGVTGTADSIDGMGVHGDVTHTGNTAAGVKGTSDSASGFGVWGRNTRDLGTGVFGEGTTGVTGEGVSIGLHGTSNPGDSIAVLAESEQGVGLSAVAGGVAVRAESDGTQLLLTGTPDPPLGVNSTREAGELVFDTNEDLWLCVVAGKPGTWRRISGPSTAGAFVPLPAPVRVYDSRAGFPPSTGPKTKLVANTARTVDCTLSSSGVPVGASGVLVNLVATNTDAAGFMTIYKDGIAWPGTSNLNFGADQTAAVTTFSALSAAAAVAVRANVGTHVVVDILGFYQ